MAAKIATERSKVLFKIFEPSTFATAIDAPCAPFLASNIIDIFSGISPAIGLTITASMTTETQGLLRRLQGHVQTVPPLQKYQLCLQQRVSWLVQNAFWVLHGVHFHASLFQEESVSSPFSSHGKQMQDTLKTIQ